MKLLQGALLVAGAMLVLLWSGCGNSCVHRITNCLLCQHLIQYEDTSGITRYAYTLPGGNDAIIPDCKRIISDTTLDGFWSILLSL
jgi:hypothetical protein